MHAIKKKSIKKTKNQKQKQKQKHENLTKCMQFIHCKPVCFSIVDIVLWVVFKIGDSIMYVNCFWFCFAFEFGCVGCCMDPISQKQKINTVKTITDINTYTKQEPKNTYKHKVRKYH